MREKKKNNRELADFLHTISLMRTFLTAFLLFFIAQVSLANTEVHLKAGEISIFTSESLIEKIFTEGLDRIHLMDPKTKKLLYVLEVVYQNKIPSALILNGEKAFSFGKRIESLIEKQGDKTRNLSQSIEATMKDVVQFIQDSPPLSRVESEVKKTNTYVLEWSHKGRALVADLAGVILLSLASISPIPGAALFILKFVAKPLANYATNHYQRGVEIYTERSGKPARKITPLISFASNAYQKIETQMMNHTKRTYSYLRSSASQSLMIQVFRFRSAHCKALF